MAAAGKVAARRSASCRHVLHNMCPVSLGIPRSERNEYLDQAAQLIGKGLDGTKKALEAEVAEMENELKGGLYKLNDKEARHSAAKKLAEDANKVHDAANAASTQAEKVHQDKLDAKTKEDAVLAKAKVNLQQATDAKQFLEELCSKHFLPLKEGRFSSQADGHKRLETLMPNLRSWSVEDCLLASFEKTALHEPSDRSSFCSDAVNEVEKQFRKKMIDAEETYRKAKDAFEVATNAAATAAKALDDADNTRAVADERRASAATAKDAADAALLKATNELADAQREADLAKNVLQAKKKELEDFINGPLADYYFLLSHETLGYTTSSLSSADGTAHAVEPSDKERVTSAIQEIEDAESPCGRTRGMLMDIAHGCLGPKQGARDGVQAEAVKMVGRALDEKKTDFQKAIGGIFPGVGTTKFMLAPKLLDGLKEDQKNGTNLANQLVKEKEEDLAALRKRRIDLCGGPCEKTKQAAANARGALERARVEKLMRNDAYHKHFVPLRDGCPLVDVAGHINILEPLLPIWGCEDCLLHGFLVVPRKLPAERGDWCRKTVAEVDKVILVALKAAQDAVDAANAALQRAEAEAKRAAEDCVRAKRAEAAANDELEAARRVQAKVCDLVRLVEQIAIILK